MPRDGWSRIPWMRVVGAAGGVALLVISVRTALAPERHSVYPIYSQAARQWLAGESTYSGPGEPYRYGPPATTLLVPFALLPNWLGGVIWRWTGAAIYGGALAWFWQRVIPERRVQGKKTLWFLLVLPLSLGSLNNGQSNVLVLGLLLAAVAAVATRRWTWASVMLALASSFKVYPISVALILTVLYPRRLGWRLALALATAITLPFVLQDPGYVAGQYREWLGHLRANDRHLLAPHLWYRDLRLLTELVGVHVSYELYQVVQGLFGAGLALWCVAGQRAGWPPRDLLTRVLGLGCCWMTVFGPATESSTYILLAPSAAWLVLDGTAFEMSGSRRWLAWSGYGLLFAATVLEMLGAPRILILRALQPLAALCLLGVLLRGHQPAARIAEERLCPDY